MFDDELALLEVDPRDQRIHALTEQVGQERESNLLLSEALDSLQMEDRGWVAFNAQIQTEFTATGRQQIVQSCRMMAIAHPLLKRGLTVRAGYIWGQGVEVTARVPGADGKADPVLQDAVNQVIDGYEKLNENSFTGMGAREELERALGTDGEVFLALFTDPAAGTVKVRTVPQLEIQMIFTNPEDADDPWFYVREYTVKQLPKAGETLAVTPTKLVRVIYPALGLDWDQVAAQMKWGFKPSVLNGAQVMWDAPMVHVPVNRLDGWERGIPDVYASAAWARLYQDFLVDWSRLTKAYSKIAWKATGESKSRAAAVATAIKAQQSAAATQFPLAASQAGSTVVTGPGTSFEAVSKSGATIDSQSGKPLAAMIAAGLGIPVTALLADPGVTGARAVAETLDTPTMLEMGMRRLIWQSVMHRILIHTIQTAAMQPGSKLRALTGDREPVLEFSWPLLNEQDPLQIVTAIVQADGTGKMPPLTTLRLILSALGVPNVDEVLTEVTDKDGNFIDPVQSTAQNAGNAAAQAFRRGEDPSALLRGEQQTSASVR